MPSKNKPDAIVSGAGWGMQFLIGVIVNLRARGWDNERIHALVTKEGEEALARGIQGFCDAIAGPTLTPPEGARIHTLTVRVRPGQPWEEAVNAAGPDTPDSYNVRKVGDQYPATTGPEVEEELILLNYPRGGSWKKALAWGEQMRLERTDPREVFAIGEQHPNLHRELGLNPMYAVATTDCTFDGRRYACCMWWYVSGRRARLLWVGNFVGSDDWFVFRKRSSELGI